MKRATGRYRALVLTMAATNMSFYALRLIIAFRLDRRCTANAFPRDPGSVITCFLLNTHCIAVRVSFLHIIYITCWPRSADKIPGVFQAISCGEQRGLTWIHHGGRPQLWISSYPRIKAGT